jgi:sugar lactone lactonase YvrE
VFATIPEGLGMPDGAAIDSEGGYRCALHGGSKLRRFNSDGSVDHDVDLPVSQPTMCAFAGEGLATIYVTSASYKLSEGREGQATAHGVSPGRTGIARQLFAL